MVEGFMECRRPPAYPPYKRKRKRKGGKERRKLREGGGEITTTWCEAVSRPVARSSGAGPVSLSGWGEGLSGLKKALTAQEHSRLSGAAGCDDGGAGSVPSL